jgi:hypothetical protein
MIVPALSSQRLLAACLTLVAVGAIVALEGLFFREELARLASPPPTIVQRVGVGNEGRAAFVMLRVLGNGTNDPGRPVAGVYDLAASPPRLQIFQTESPPRRVVIAPQGPLGFLTTESGALYAFDSGGELRSLTHLGTHPDPHPPVLECSGDASQGVMAGNDMTSWSRSPGRCLWRRDDLSVASARFLPGASRLLCGLYRGDVVVLDAASGQTLEKLHRHPDGIIGLAVSPVGEWLASFDALGNCFLTELGSRRRAWSARYEPTTATFQFSACGRQLLIANPRIGVDLAVVASATGEVEREFSDWDDGVAGLSLAESGAVLVWSNRGPALLVRDLASRAVVHELAPGRSLHLLERPPAVAHENETKD